MKRKAASGFIILLALAGCVRIGSKAPRELLVLTAMEVPGVGTQRQANSPSDVITILVPSAAAPVSTARVPVYQADVAVAYVKEAVFADALPQQFSRILMETIAARTGRVALDYRQSSAASGLKLQGSLHRFGIEEASMRAVLVYDAVLVRRDGSIVAKRFEGRSEPTAIEARAVGSALNKAAGDVAGQVADWIKAL